MQTPLHRVHSTPSMQAVSTTAHFINPSDRKPIPLKHANPFTHLQVDINDESSRRARRSDRADPRGCWNALNRIKNKSRIEEAMGDHGDSVSLYHYLSRKYKEGVARPRPLKVCLGSGSVVTQAHQCHSTSAASGPATGISFAFLLLMRGLEKMRMKRCAIRGGLGGADAPERSGLTGKRRPLRADYCPKRTETEFPLRFTTTRSRKAFGSTGSSSKYPAAAATGFLLVPRVISSEGPNVPSPTPT